MLYVSTRGQAPALQFEEAVLEGLANDGGLYLPKHCPEISLNEIMKLGGLNYIDLSFYIMRKFIGSGLSDDNLYEVINRSYTNFGVDDFCPTVHISGNEYILELFHGPTLAFKDFAMQFIGNLFQFLLRGNKKRLTIVTATSGDTGSAAVEAFKGKDQIDLVVLFPDGLISDVQRKQMTTSRCSNIFPLAVKGDFDECQRMVKELFNDRKFKDRVNLSAVNSINWARILAQIVYFFRSALTLESLDGGVNFSVPTGNFGDIYAGYIAKKMGLPIKRLLIASNQNNILQRMLSTGIYDKKDTMATVAPAMDIQVSSNFERLLLDLLEGNQYDVSKKMSSLTKQGKFQIGDDSLKRFRENFYSESGNDDELKREIAFFYEHFNRLICPHTAAGTLTARRYLCEDPNTPVITLSTAHPCKFNDTITSTLGVEAVMPARLKKIISSDENFERLSNNTELLKEFILARLQL